MFYNKKIIIISIVFTIAILFLVFLVIPFLFKKIIKESEELVAAQKDLFLFRAMLDSVEEIKQGYDGCVSDLETIDDLFIDPEIPIDLIKFWEKTAADSEVSIDIIPVSSKSEASDFWKPVVFQITATGYFPDFLRFLQKIESGPYLTKIKSLSAKKLSERDTVLKKVKTVLSVEVFSK